MNMMNFICNKINAKPKDKYKILTFSTHEAYQEAMANTGHTFYVLEAEGLKKWNERYRKLPSNYVIINDFNKIPYDVDFMLSQERYSQLQTMMGMSRKLRLPLIHIDHVEPIKNEQFPVLKKLTADFHVFISEHNRISWENEKGLVIPHGINTDTFNNWSPNDSKTVVYVVNFLKERDFFCGWKEWNYIRSKVNDTNPSIKFKLVGDNPGMSSTISDPLELSKALRGCACYLNTSKFSPVPMSLLEAMSMGMPVVSTKYQQVAKILNDTNSVSSNNLDDLVDGIIDICSHNNDYKDLGLKARSNILDKYSMSAFVNNWNQLFDQAYNMTLGGAHEIFYI